MMGSSDIDCAVFAGANALGFVVEIEHSRHCLSREEAKAMIKRVPVFVQTVAVIAPADIGEAMRLAKETKADLLQIHGTLGRGEIRALKNLVPQKIIAATSAGAGSENVHGLQEEADAVLLDTLKDGILGGSGAIHDWNLSAALARSLNVPVILAGGLNAANVGEAIRKVRPYAVDVSSGVETDGRKDPALVQAFVDQVRACP
jgi:phosphoribosylanthranilate isomerase